MALLLPFIVDSGHFLDCKLSIAGVIALFFLFFFNRLFSHIDILGLVLNFSLGLIVQSFSLGR